VVTIIYNEKKQDLFQVPERYYLAHCISSDYALGAGIAVQFEKRFDLRRQLKEHGHVDHPDCIKVGRVFNLITKELYWHKPTYGTVREALMKMKAMAIDEGITYIAMPTIASGLDRLMWARVREIIIDVFRDTDIEILVCVL